MAERTWAAGETFSMADCAAMPPLFYVDAIYPYRTTYPALAAYFERLASRPSVQRVIREAQPWLPYFPFPDGIQIAAQAGVTAIIQPGGSIRDEMAIEVADRHHMAMVFTGRRHFKH